MITRRDALVGLMALSGALTEACPRAGWTEHATAILGPTVFHWDEMKSQTNAVGEGPLALQAAHGHARSVGDARQHAQPRQDVASAAPARERGADHYSRRRLRDALERASGSRSGRARWSSTRRTACTVSATSARRRPSITSSTGARTRIWYRSRHLSRKDQRCLSIPAEARH